MIADEIEDADDAPLGNTSTGFYYNPSPSFYDYKTALPTSTLYDSLGSFKLLKTSSPSPRITIPSR
jgi:hypothetical protein